MKKDQSIQALRGLAIILMVAGHVIGNDALRGLRVDDDSVWRYSWLALVDVRMPLFTLISGVVYAQRPLRDWSGYPGLVRGKSQRLLIPLVTVGTALWLVKQVAPATNTGSPDLPLWEVYVYGYEHLWFVQAIFLIFLVVGALDAVGALDRRGPWLVAVVVASALYVAIPVPHDADVFSVSGTLRLLPFFLLGYGVVRHRVLDTLTPVVVGAAVVVLVSAYTVRYGDRIGSWDLPDTEGRLLSVLVGLVAVSALYLGRHLVEWRWLAWLGGYSYGIYLLHVFPAAASRIGLQHLGVDSDAVCFVVGLTAGLLGPVVVQVLTRRSGVVQLCVFGEKRRPQALTDSRSGASLGGSTNR